VNRPIGWKVGTCPVCKTPGKRFGKPWLGVLGATPADDLMRFVIDVPDQCADCLKKLGLNRRNYGIPGTEHDGGLVAAIGRFFRTARRKVDEHWNYMADNGGLDPIDFQPMKKRKIR